MDEKSKAVEIKVQTAATEQEVKKVENTASDSQDDLELQLAATEEALKQSLSERDNYKRGLLKAKGKVQEESVDDVPDEKLEAIIDRKVQERLYDTKVVELQRQKDTLLNKAVKENKELKIALKNRSQIQNASTGTSADLSETKSPFFSQEQLAEIERRSKMIGVKIDPEKVKANLLKKAK